VVLEKGGEDQLGRSFENEEVLLRVKKERNILHTVKTRKANWIGHILHSNCFMKYVVEGKIDGRI
jgi:superfamily I DNA and RNA helicase